MPSVDEKVSNLERVLEEFIKNVGNAQMRTEAELREFKDEMRAFREESERDRKFLHDEMKEFKDEMREFKDEMKVFKEETREEHKRMNKRWGEISNKLGTIVEDIIYPALRPVIRQYFNCEPLYMSMNIKKRMGELKDEYDAIVECEDMVFLVEVKAYPRIEYINEFRDKKIERFKTLFQEYKGKRLIPVFASLRLEEDIIEYLTESNIYAMAYREWEYMDILNFDRIKLN
ncbi:MAG: hypothetical protein OHK0032_13850 [Thermodesulfovibrionales bacterium]